MYNSLKSRPLYEVGRKLTQTAMGEIPADTVIRNITLINVCTRELLPHTDVAVKEGRIALVGDASHCVGEGTKVLDGTGQYLAPGFLDGHMHIESSMMTVASYAEAVLPHGTTGVYSDPHEIGNVLGMEGVRLMAEESKGTPLKNMITLPSCVPAVDGLEDNGYTISAEEVAEAMTWDSVVGLGEMMNFPGILNGQEKPHRIVEETLKAGKTVTGHYTASDQKKGLNAYTANGIRCCHESVTAEEALAKMRLGMYAQLREGSGWRDLHKVAEAVTKHEVDSRFAMLVTDDTHPDTLQTKGHLDYLIRRAMEEGIDVLTAIQMVTINCAQCFHMDQDLGSVTPGKCADLVFLDDLEKVHVVRTMIDGVVVAENGKVTAPVRHLEYPAHAKQTIHIRDAITAETFRIPAPISDGTVTIRVIGAIPGKAGTEELHETVTVQNGYLESDLEQDILKACVFERHHNTGTRGLGFIRGFHLQSGAIGTTVGHDAHNLMVIGTNDADMAAAANAIKEAGGGLAVVQKGKVLSLVPLPIAGIMSEEPVEAMQKRVEELEQAYLQIGCDVPAPYMTMAIASLACIPELRLTNRGLVNCVDFAFTDLVIESETEI